MTEKTISIKKVFEVALAPDVRINCWDDTKQVYKESPDFESTVYLGPIIRIPEKNSTHTNLTVVENDCIYAALEAPTGRTCILNMADWCKAGGLVEAGSRAQEEELFRRSNLFKHLHQKYYPMRLNQTVYSHNVEFFKQGADQYYKRMSTPIKFDVISAPSLCGVPTTLCGQYFRKETDAVTMMEKIRQLFLIAAEQKVDTLILSAWGCGAFGGPPINTAQLFKQVIEEFDGLIPNVVFAVLGYNYEPFNFILATG